MQCCKHQFVWCKWVREAQTLRGFVKHKFSAPKIDSAPKKCHAFRLSINACKNHCNQAKGRQIRKINFFCSLMGDVTYSECAAQWAGICKKLLQIKSVGITVYIAHFTFVLLCIPTSTIDYTMQNSTRQGPRLDSIAVSLLTNSEPAAATPLRVMHKFSTDSWIGRRQCYLSPLDF